MIAPPETTRKVWTEEELQALPDEGYIYEVAHGELVMSPKNNFEHENLCAELLVAMRTFAQARRLGVVLGSNAGFWMRNQDCRAPDVSFIPKERLRSLGFTPFTRRFFPGAPDLAVGVLSPSNTRVELDERLKQFFSSGTQIAWIVDPQSERVEVCHSPTQRKLLGTGGELDGEHLLPGFRYPIADLFKEWDWDRRPPPVPVGGAGRGSS